MPINYAMKNSDTQLLRALAILFIINSHLDRYYPIPHIGTGGAIGNSIFFFLSAYGLYISQQANSKNFKEWFAHRVARIYPSLWIVLILLLMPILIWQGKLSYNSITSFIGYFFNPPFWFLQALLVYYLLTFSLIKNSRKTYILSTMSLLSLIYMGCYISVIDLSRWSVEESPFDLIHYLMVFIFGIYVAKMNKDINYSGVRDYVFLISIICLVYAHKFFMYKGFYHEYQFLQQLSMYPIVFYMLKISRSPIIAKPLKHSPSLSRSVDFIANHTLEIYMVHQTISGLVIHLGMPFPLNVFVFLILTLCLSAIVKRLADSLRKSVL